MRLSWQRTNWSWPFLFVSGIFATVKNSICFAFSCSTHKHNCTKVHLLIRHWGLVETKYFISLNMFQFCFSTIFALQFDLPPYTCICTLLLGSWINKNKNFFTYYFSPFGSHRFRFISILLTNNAIISIDWYSAMDPLFLKLLFLWAHTYSECTNVRIYGKGATSIQYDNICIGLTN